MINKKLLSEFMNTSPTSLKEFSDFINGLIKEHGRETIITNAGIDKNVLYRASNSQNITLDNYYKIKKAFHNTLKSTTQSDYINELPLLGQIVDNTKVRLLNPSQPKSVPVPAPFIQEWSPVFGYLNTSGTAYSGFVFVFSGKNLEKDNKSIGNKCVNRLIITYPEDDDPQYGMVLKVDKSFILVHPETREVIGEIPTDNNISWSKFICLIPYSLMENYEEPTYQNNIHKLEEKFHKDCGDEHKHLK
tara:strand:- start:68 stop:808 length:741 start_codon:yes stop_codon:yes gene_type:complete